MDPLELHEVIEDVFVLDVREPEEWDAGHIDVAVHIPMGQLKDRKSVV